MKGNRRFRRIGTETRKLWATEVSGDRTRFRRRRATGVSGASETGSRGHRATGVQGEPERRFRGSGQPRSRKNRKRNGSSHGQPELRTDRRIEGTPGNRGRQRAETNFRKQRATEASAERWATGVPGKIQATGDFKGRHAGSHRGMVTEAHEERGRKLSGLERGKHQEAEIR